MSAARPAVLIVDDDPDIREIVSIFLELQGVKVLGAEDGVEALTMLRDSAKVGLVLLDLMMPRMNGIDVLREIKRDPKLASLHVVVLSGNCEARSTVMALGADACMQKPIEVDDLARLVHQYVE